MKKMDKKFAKKVATTAVAVVCVCGVAVGGTLAALHYSLEGNQGLKNTFVASNGLIEPEDPNSPKGDLKFYLDEAKVELKDGNYKADNNVARVKTNEYTNVTDGMTLDKDPTVKVDLITGETAYTYIVVNNSVSDEAIDNIEIDDAFEQIGTNGNDTLYIYKKNGNAAITGIDGNDIEVHVLKDETLNVADASKLGADSELKVDAYVCQVAGYSDPLNAFNTEFGKNFAK